MFGSKKDTVVAVADIGSGSAGFSIVKVSHSGAGELLAADRSILPLEERTREQTMSGVIRMISEAGNNVLKAYLAGDAAKKLGPPTASYGIIRAPWTRASSGRASRVSQKEEVITKDAITALAHQALEKDMELDRSNLLDTCVIRVELNEYPTSSPIGKKAHRLDIITFESDCDPIMRKMISDALLSLFPGRPPTLRSGARSFLKVTQDEMDHPPAYVLLDMVSEATTVMAVRDGAITHHASIPEGVRTILRRIAGTQGMSEEVLNLMRMVVADSCSGEACDALNAALAKIEPELVRVFGEAVAGIIGKERLPDTLYLTAHPDITPWLAHVFARIDFAQFTVTLRPFNVHVITPEFLKDAVVVHNGITTDIGNVVAAAFVNIDASGRQ